MNNTTFEPNLGAIGHPLVGVRAGKTKFQGSSTLNQLQAYGLCRPSLLQKTTSREAAYDPRLCEAKSVREQVQRRFDALRTKRAESYSAYIEKVECLGQIGGTPAITLYLAASVDVSERVLLIPYNSTLVAIDGETQTEARFLLRDRLKVTGDNPIAVTVYHDVTEECAQQILHDYNVNGLPVSNKVAASTDHVGPLSAATNRALMAAGLEARQVNRNGEKPGRGYLIAHQQALYASVGYAMTSQALDSDGGRWLKELNKPECQLFNGHSVPTLARIMAQVKTNTHARLAHKLIWQAAGALTAQNKAPENFNWETACKAFGDTQGGKGRVKHKTADRLKFLAASLESKR